MKKNIFIIVFVLSILSPNLRAQIISAGDFLAPGAPPPMIGIEIGLGSHMQMGTFQASCSCEFDNGSGTGFLGGLLFELPLDYEWTIGIGAKIDFKHYSSTTNVSDTATVTFSNSDSAASGYALVERDGSVKETFLTLAPFIRYELARNGPFIQIGPGIEFLLSSDFTHTRVLNSSTITLTDINDPTKQSTYDNVRFQNGTRQETLQTGSIVNAATTRISAIATVGWNLSIGDRSVLAPMISYDFPFTTVRPDFVGADGASNWKIASLYFSIGLKYKLE
jgi:hypothetical protein